MKREKGKNIQIIKEHILQLQNGVCAFYDMGKIVDMDTGEVEYLNPELLNTIFPLFDKYAETQMKRAGVWKKEEEKEVTKCRN